MYNYILSKISSFFFYVFNVKYKNYDDIENHDDVENYDDIMSYDRIYKNMDNMKLLKNCNS
jgi:hypothetical protein